MSQKSQEPNPNSPCPDPENPPDKGEGRGSIHSNIPGERSVLHKSDLHTLIRNRRVNEKQLLTRYSLLQGVVEGADCGIFTVNAEFCYTSFNTRHVQDLQEIYGVEAVAGGNLSDLFCIGKEYRKIRHLLECALAGETVTDGDYFGDNARSRRYFGCSGYPIRNEHGAITGAAMILRDMTDVKRTEKELGEREEQFRSLAENSPVMVYRMSLPQGHLEYVSQAAVNLTGYSPEEFYRDPALIREIVHPAWKESNRVAWENMIQGKMPAGAEFQIIHKNGEVRWVHRNHTGIRDTRGRIIAIEGIIIDITAQKTSAIELGERETWFHTLFDLAEVGILLMDATTRRIVDVNPEALKLIGASRNEVLNQECRRFIRIPKQETCPGQAIDSSVSSFDDALLTPGGRNIPARITIAPVTMAGRDMLIGSFIEISEQKLAFDILRGSEAGYRTFIADSSEGIFRLETGDDIPVTLPADEQIALFFKHFSFAECNNALAKMYGISDAGELIGKKFGEVMDPCDPRLIETLRRLVCQCYRIVDQESEELDRMGVSHWFSRSLSGIVIDGRIIRIWGIQRDITERKRADTMLQELGERYDALFTHSGECVYTTDLSGRFIDANHAALDLIGFRKEEICGIVFASLLDPSQGDRARDERTEIVTTGSQEKISEYALRHKDGHIIEVESRGSLISHEENPIAIQYLVRDITARKQIEAKLIRSETEFRSIVENSKDTIYTVDFSGTLTSVSPSVRDILGYSADEVIGKNLCGFLTPVSWRHVTEAMEEIRDGQRTEARFDVELIAKDGHTAFFEVNNRIRTEGGSGPDIVGIARDISERKKIEDALQESEVHLRTLLQTMPSVAIRGYQSDFTIIFWNETCFRIYGYTEDEALGKDIRDLIFPSGVRDGVTHAIASMAESGIPEPPGELIMARKDGMTVPVCSSHVVVKTPGKNTIIYSVDIDLTEQRKIVNALREEENHLQSIINNAPFGTFVFDLNDEDNLVVTSCNCPTGGFIGMDCSGCTGKTIGSAFPALVSTGINGAFIEVARTGKPLHIEAFDGSGTGIPGVFEIHAIQLEPGRIAVFFRDIAEKKKAEDDLKRNETRFRSLIQNSSDFIQILDPGKRLIYNSPASLKLLGYKEESLKNSLVLELVHPEDRARVLAGLEEVCTGTNPGIPIEYRILKAGGDYIYVESVGVNLIDVPGINGTVIYTHEVNERKLAERALQEINERFSLIFQNSGDAICLSEITPSGMFGKIIDANEAALIQTGYTYAELRQKTLTEISVRELAQKSHGIMMELFTRGEARFETGLHRKDGSLLPVEISTRLAKQDGRTYIISVSRDVSQKNREERAFHIASQKIQLRNIVAWHEVRNRIEALRSCAESSGEGAMEEKLKKFIDGDEGVLKAIQRQMQYAGEYQELGSHPPQWLNIPRILQVIVSSRGAGPLKFTMDAGDFELFCDPIIGKVFSRLVDNTRKHAKTATEIHVAWSETADGLRIVFEDNGVGIPSDKKKDLFVQGTGASSGLSLSFVHDILEISDMTIRECGEPGKGARFEINVPRGIFRLGL